MLLLHSPCSKLQFPNNLKLFTQRIVFDGFKGDEMLRELRRTGLLGSDGFTAKNRRYNKLSISNDDKLTNFWNMCSWAHDFILQITIIRASSPKIESSYYF